MVANQGQITKINTNPNAGLVDGSDKLHSGILKALTAFNKGDVCIGHAGFTITDGGTYTQYNLAQPIHYFYNNNYKTYGTNLTVAYSSPGVQDSTHDRYDWVLLNPNNGGTPSLVIVQGGAASNPTVADITADYIPIALIKIDAASTSDDDKTNYSFQLYTLNKQANSLSIGYDAGTYFAESGKITGDADSIDIVTSITNADINITPNGDGKIVLDGLNWPIADGTANQVLKTDGSNQLSFTTISSNSITDADGDTKIQVEESADEDKIRFDTGGTERAVIDSTGLGIGTNAPDAALHVRGSSNPTVRIQEDSQTGYLDLSGLQDSQASITAQNDTASEVSILDITAKCNSSSGTGQEVRIFRNARTNADGTFSIKQPGTNTNVMVVSSDSAGSAHTMYLDGTLAVNKTSAASGVTLEVNGDVGGDKFKVESIQYELASDFTSAGAVPGPASAPSLTLTDTDSIYRITTTVGNPPGTAALDVVFPATTGNEGLVLKLIFPSIAGAPDDLVLKGSGTETIIAPDNSVLAASGGGYTLTTAGVYEAICISGSWIFYKIN